MKDVCIMIGLGVLMAVTVVVMTLGIVDAIQYL